MSSPVENTSKFRKWTPTGVDQIKSPKNPTGIIPVRVIPDNDIFNYDQGQMFLGMGNHLGH